MILKNEKQDVLQLLQTAVEGEVNLELYPEEKQSIGYFDKENGYERTYFFDETIASLEHRIQMDPKVETILSKKKLASFLFHHLDENAMMVLNELVFIFETEESPSLVREQLEKDYCDEYAKYISEDMLGTTWVERQIAIINVSNILRAASEILEDEEDWMSLDYLFMEGVLQTIFHECRHLVYECNEIIPRGKGTIYPKEGETEEQVEAYGNRKASRYFSSFYPCEKPKLVENLTQLKEELEQETTNIILE